MEKEIDHNYTDEIVCPYCGYEFGDSCDFDCSEEKIPCNECEETFIAYREVEVHYSTWKTEEN